MKYFAPQIKTNDCLFACMKMMLAISFKNKNFLYYCQVKEDINYSLKDVIFIAKKEGLLLGAYRVKRKVEIKHNKKFPLILIFKNGDSLHSVVLIKKTFKKFKIYDPAKGVIYLKYKDLEKMWNGEYLEAIKKEKTKYKMKRKKFVNKYLFIQTFFQIFSFVSIAIGLYFLNRQISFVIPLSLFISYVIFELLQKFFFIKSLKKFDDSIIKNINFDNKKDLINVYQSMNDYKILNFGVPISFITQFITLVLSLIILGVNSYLNFINVTIILLTHLILFLATKRIIVNNEKIVKFSEQKIKNGGGDENSFKNAFNSNYNYANILNIKQYICLIIIIILCLFYASFTNNITPNFIIFHFFFYHFISNSFLSLFEIISKFKKYKFLKIYFQNITS